MCWGLGWRECERGTEEWEVWSELECARFWIAPVDPVWPDPQISAGSSAVLTRKAYILLSKETSDCGLWSINIRGGATRGPVGSRKTDATPFLKPRLFRTVVAYRRGTVVASCPVNHCHLWRPRHCRNRNGDVITPHNSLRHLVDNFALRQHHWPMPCDVTLCRRNAGWQSMSPSQGASRSLISRVRVRNTHQ